MNNNNYNNNNEEEEEEACLQSSVQKQPFIFNQISLITLTESTRALALSWNILQFDK